MTRRTDVTRVTARDPMADVPGTTAIPMTRRPR
jgi:hypothetical protein